MTGAFALLASPAWAEIVSTDQALMQGERDRVRTFMQREDVQRQLKDLGLPPELAQQRTGALTDEEVRVIAGKLDTLPAGSALDKNDWIIILLVVILALILLQRAAGMARASGMARAAQRRDARPRAAAPLLENEFRKQLDVPHAR